MKFFLDTAIVDDIKKAAEFGVLDGVTTNPTLMKKSGRKQKEVIQEIAEICKGPISVEAIGKTTEEMVKEGEEYFKWAPNIVVKIPMTSEGLKAIHILSKKGIRTNVTLVFSPSQAILAAKAGATYVSPFIGRLDDISHFGIELVRDISTIYKNYGYKTEIIVASVRHPVHVMESALIGADIVTLPYPVFERLWKHPLTDKGVEKFLDDYAKSQK